MKNFLVYSGQVMLVSGILYGYYYFFLRNKQFHQYNRFYLLAVTLLSLFIPFIRIPVSFNGSVQQSPAIIRMLQTISINEAEAGPATALEIGSTSFNWSLLVYAIYVLVVVLLLTRMLFSLLKIWKITRRYPVERLNGIRFVKTQEPGTPFSFFRWLFWDNTISMESSRGMQIFRHEVFHIRQKHSWDVIFLEVIKTACWINPFFHLIKKELRAIHEFLADEFALDKEEKWVYAELLLMQTLNTQQPLVNPFFHNQIKRRIAMITKPQPSSRRYLRKLLVLPLAILLLGLVAFRYKPGSVIINYRPTETITVIVDPGHGGELDPGVKSPDDKHKEAPLTLELANAIRKLAPEYGIKVVLTRETNEAMGITKQDDLRKRVEMVKEIAPAAFLSLHINSAGRQGEYQQHHSGFEAYIAGKRTDKSGQLLASAILDKLSNVYKTKMQIQQRKNESIYLLDHNTCPSVMLECGYINNRQDLTLLTNKDSQEKIARVILSALKDYAKA